MADMSRHPAMAVIPVINIMVSLMTILMEPEMSRKPFRAVWNYPDSPCRNLGIDFNLANYSIESNSQEFKGDTIALYYSSGFGKWPYIEFGNETDIPVFGGWPHEVELTPHLQHIQEEIMTHQSPYTSGFGVIDMELWRPILKTNYGVFAGYKTKYIDHIARTNPHLETFQEHRKRADELWSLSTKLIMLMSLSLAQMTRPHAHWGYYGYPEIVTAPHNHELDWLWQTVTAFYPSIYIKNYSMPIEDNEDKIKAAIAESFRMRAVFGNPDHPIMAYVDVQNIPEKGRDEWLRLQLNVPIDMGVDGIILWASSKHLAYPRQSCRDIQTYVRDEVGPIIAEMTRYLSSCSQQLCSNRGRCVRKTYARNYPYLVSRGIGKKGDGVEAVQPLLYKKIYTGFKRDYQCQCYTGWYGKRCVEKERRDEDQKR